MSAGLVGFPKRLSFVHKYVDSESFTIGAGVVSIRQWSCNGLYDPNITGAGHQPSYFDQVATLYDHYTVFRSRMTLKLLSQSSIVAFSFYIDDDTSTAGIPSTAAEQGTGITQMVPSTAVRTCNMSKTWSAKQYFGGDIYDNDNLSGSNAANPAEQSYFTLVAQSVDAGTFTYYMQYEIIYEAVWDELKTIAQS